MKLTIGRRYFCTRYSKAESSPAFTRSMTSASLLPPSDRLGLGFECRLLRAARHSKQPAIHGYAAHL